jgi:hypothetical protein
MELSKILTQLYDFFDDNKHKKNEKREIHTLLEKLKRKENKLEKELDDTNDNHKKKTIKRSLKIIRAQKKKGKKILSD